MSRLGSTFETRSGSRASGSASDRRRSRPRRAPPLSSKRLRPSHRPVKRTSDVNELRVHLVWVVDPDGATHLTLTAIGGL